MRCEAGAKRRRNVAFGPARDFEKWPPERFLVQVWIRNIGAGYHQCIEPRVLQILEATVVTVYVLTGLRAALQRRPEFRGAATPCRAANTTVQLIP